MHGERCTPEGNGSPRRCPYIALALGHRKWHVFRALSFGGGGLRLNVKATDDHYNDMNLSWDQHFRSPRRSTYYDELDPRSDMNISMLILPAGRLHLDPGRPSVYRVGNVYAICVQRQRLKYRTSHSAISIYTTVDCGSGYYLTVMRSSSWYGGVQI